MKPIFPIRGVMLDPGRNTEQKQYYTRLLPWLAEWGFNLLHLHLTDDQRCALVFPSRPELATPGAFTADEMRELVRRAGELGITVVPEIECLGHTDLITSHPRYQSLAEKNPEKPGYNAICPSHPKTRELLADILRDVAHIFPGPLIHLGLDEVSFGRCARCRRAFGTDAPSWRRFANHARWVHQVVRRLGRRPAMWADHLLSEPQIARSFQRDVLMFNWQYVAEYEPGRAKALLDMGFEVVACPALVCYGTRVVPNLMNLSNLRTTSAHSMAQRSATGGVVGMVSTVWAPWRYLPGAVDFGMAFAGHLSSVDQEHPRFAEQFARRFYGLADGHAVGRALVSLHECGMSSELFDRAIGSGSHGRTRGGKPVSLTREDLRRFSAVADRLRPVIQALRRERKGVRSNHDRYEDVLISAQSLRLVAEFATGGPSPGLARSASRLYDQALSSWRRDRLPADPFRFGEQTHDFMQSESLLAVLRQLRRIRG